MIYATAKKRISIIVVITSLLLLIIGIKLSYLTIYRNNILSSLATDLWQRSLPLTASRGFIFDRNGTKLTYNEPVVSVVAIPFQIEDKSETAKLIAPILNMDTNVLENKISKNTSMVRIHPEGKKINDEQAKAISDLNLKGIYLVQDNKRTYPYKEQLASLLGFVGIDNQGLAGLEYIYDSYLTGVDGQLNYLMDAKGGLFENETSTIVAPIQGLSLKLTLDLNIQGILEREIVNAQVKYNPKEIIGLIMNPKDGTILAIGNRPTYDNNNYEAYDNKVYNQFLPVFSSFEPGSTFKALSFAAALNENVIDMNNGYYYDKGYEKIGGATIKSWKKGGHGLQTWLEVLQNSSNPGFVEIARRLGKDRLYNYFKEFGIGEKTGVDIQGEGTGIMFNYDKYGILEQATSAFGQGLSTTPIQLLTAFCSVINGGYLYQPRIADSLISSMNNETIYTFKSVLKRQVISEETSEKMRHALECVVAYATGKKAYLNGYRVGGKTGTAQIAENGAYVDGKYVLSFIAAAPMNDPQVAVYFAIREPKSTIQYGGTTVGPIIQNILRDVLPYLNISKQDGGLKKIYTWMDDKYHAVSNYIGLTKKEVKSTLYKFNFIGEGDKVIDQLPRVGEFVKEGSNVVILLGE